MYFPRPYPDELLYSAIARCRVHLGMGSHKGLLAMLFGDTRVAAVTDLPSHLQSLAGNTGLDAEELVANHTLFPLYAPFIPKERRLKLHQAMLAPDQPGALGLAGVSTALVKWPGQLRCCPLCFEEMVASYGEPYWRRCWQVQGVDACPEHGCLLWDSPLAFRRAQRHEFHAASPRLLPGGTKVVPAGKGAIRLAAGLSQLLVFQGRDSPGYGQWTSFYRRLASECGAMRGRQVRATVIWDLVLACHPREQLATNGLWAAEPPPWLLALFRKHRKAFGCLQHLISWTSLRPGQRAGDIIDEACRQAELIRAQERQLPAEPATRQRYRTFWKTALNAHGGAKAARESGGQANYAWLYRHDRDWLAAANKSSRRPQGNHSHVDWPGRDRMLVRRLVRMGESAADDLGLPRRSRNWFLRQLPHSVSVEHHLDQLPLCRAFLDRYAESVGEYQVRRLTRALLEDARAGGRSKRWQLARRCGLDKSRITPLAESFIEQVGGLD
ncbi:TnsD family Tn7-like transposition protein [Gallaecimonas pentaromativorans]|uniref:TnsD family Tn7-like transposition protein n=1 Tax=Gallaecimonas pentaromativorans TaxID=584787 RepID=UPI00067E9813|nr:TnsD family Tn7-like transposition protein [Gallaecimonas pentaromativorans]